MPCKECDYCQERIDDVYYCEMFYADIIDINDITEPCEFHSEGDPNEGCSNCIHLRTDEWLGESYCYKLNSYTTLDDYCGYWRSYDGAKKFSKDNKESK